VVGGGWRVVGGGWRVAGGGWWVAGGGWWAGPDGIPDPVPIPEILANPDPVPLEARSRPGPGSFHEPSTEP